jgi:hypothetical protein
LNRIEGDAVLEGMNYLQRAEAALRREGLTREGLLEAGHAFWSAVFYLEQWPADLRRRAIRLQERLLAGGKIRDTIARMEEPAIRDACEELLAFIEIAESYQDE